MKELNMDDHRVYMYHPKSVQVMYRPVAIYRRENGGVPALPSIDKSSFEYQWWKEQIRRCLRGWVAPDGKYLNGYIYFHINFCKVRYTLPWSVNTNDLNYPLYRDNDDEITSILWNNRPRRKPNDKIINAKSHVEGKGRRKGWTTLLYSYFIYNFVFSGKGVFIGMAYPDKDTQETEQSEFVESYSELDPIFKRWDGEDLVVLKNSSDYGFTVGTKIDAKSNHVHASMLFTAVGSEDSADVWRGKKFTAIGVAEAGKWKGSTLRRFYDANIDAMLKGKDTIGSFIVGGTSDAINNSSTDYKTMFYQHKRIFNATQHFTPAYKVMDGFFNYFTGKSDTESAKVHLLEKRERLSENPIKLKQEVLENPMEPAEAFDPSQDTIYNFAKLEEYIRDINNNRRDRFWKRFKLEYAMDMSTGRILKDTIVPVLDEEGDWLIDTRCPVGKNNWYENLYIMGIDDKHRDKDPDKKWKKEDSRNCAVIWIRDNEALDMPTNKPAALFYSESPLQDTYEEFLKGMKYFNIGHSDALYEYHNPAFPNWLIERGESYRLYYPKQNQPGLVMANDATTNMLTLQGNELLSEGVFRNFDNTIFLEELKLWTLRNTDIASALHLCFYLLKVKSDVMLKAAKLGNQIETNYLIPGMFKNAEKRVIADTSKYIQPWAAYKR